ncbi:MAG: hypothetical protein LQ345_003831 [Seirophora villosa]|nr:MAG: hypothetical protein LQ345_003831 [Seirophora villosa]
MLISRKISPYQVIPNLIATLACFGRGACAKIRLQTRQLELNGVCLEEALSTSPHSKGNVQLFLNLRQDFHRLHGIITNLAYYVCEYELTHFRQRCQRRRAIDIMKSVNKACSLPDPPLWYEKLLRTSKDAITGLTGALHSPAPPVRVLERKAISIPEDLPESERFLPSRSCGTWFVTRRELRHLFEDSCDQGREEVLALTKEDIESKSKANGLAKVAQRIPISLLELNTFGHAVCALLIYLVWWEKPFEVDHPTILRSHELWEHFALFWTETQPTLSMIQMDRKFNQLLLRDKEFQKLDEVGSFATSSETFYVLAGRGSLFSSHLEKYQLETDEDNGQDLIRVGPGQVILGTYLKTKTAQELKDLVGDKSAYLPVIPELRLTKEDVTRLKMASAASDAGVERPKEWEEIKFSRRCPNSDYGEENRGVIFLVLTVMSLIYGGLHALAWFANFNSTTEQLLWRISSCVVMGGLPIFYVLIIEKDDGFEKGFYKFIGIVLNSEILFVLIAIAYILARAYLVVECFIQLSHMPAGVYDVPEWSAYFPHLS